MWKEMILVCIINILLFQSCEGNWFNLRQDVISQINSENLLKEKSNNITFTLRGITFEGGGFRAHAVSTGLVATLASFISNKTEPNDIMTEVFSAFDLIGSNSGGTWYMSQLAYSKNFLNMIIDISKEHKNRTAMENLYNDKWVRALPGLNMNQTAETWGEYILRWTLGSLGISDDWLPFIAHQVNGNLSWESFVDSILKSPGDLDTSKSISEAPSNAWTTNKSWIISSSLIEPAGGFDDSSFAVYRKKCIDQNNETVDRSITYSTNSSFEDGFSIPVAFSTLFGKSSQDESPVPFIRLPENETLNNMIHVMTGPGYFTIGTYLYTNTSQFKVIPGSGMHTNKVSILHASASSSAFLSQVIAMYHAIKRYVMTLIYASVWENLLRLMVPFAANSDLTINEAFENGQAVLNPFVNETCTSWENRILEKRLVNLADGAFVDNTGLSVMLQKARNGDSFTLLLNRNIVGGDIIKLFEGPFVEARFPTSKLPLFEESESYASAALATFQTLTNPENVTMLRKISYGMIEATTRDQPYLGIKAGLRVRLNIIIFDTMMGMAPMQWQDVSKMVADIVITFRSNENATTAVLKSYFGIGI